MIIMINTINAYDGDDNGSDGDGGDGDDGDGDGGVGDDGEWLLMKKKFP